MSKLTLFLRESWLLIASSFFFGFLLAVAGIAWSPRIEQNRIDKLNRLMGSLLPKAESFEEVGEVEVSTARGRKARSSLYRALGPAGKPAGWSFNCQGSGFADRIELVVAVDASFEEIAGYDCLASNETPGFGDRIKLDYYRGQFIGAPATDLELAKTGDPGMIDSKIIAITGATVSSEAVVNIINNYLYQIRTACIEKGWLTNGD